MFIKIVIFTAILMIAFMARAAGCNTQTVNIDGKLLFCTTCCDDYGNCFTNCN